MNELAQQLPTSWEARETLRRKGQFWTPDWVAEAMVAYAARGSDHIFDPAVGEGAFLRAARVVAQEWGAPLALWGMELDPAALRQAAQAGLSAGDLAGVRIGDFLTSEQPRAYRAIVANPPYIRHHRLDSRIKAYLKAYSAEIIGAPLDGRAGLHIYFLVRALTLLEPGGRLAFIMPADTCEGVFAQRLWGWISKHYRLQAVITFAPDASPFPGVDTNPVIVMIERAAPVDTFYWARCEASGTRQLKRWAMTGLGISPGADLTVQAREVAEALRTGLSRPPTLDHEGPLLGEFAAAMRGIATGANEFFFLTSEQAQALRLAPEFLIPAVGRTRDVPGDVLTRETMAALAQAGRPTWLFAPDGRDLGLFPQPVREYILHGQELGIHQRVLIATRRPWYKMEVRAAPPILFAYLGRRNVRFIRNLAGVVPLTGFICLYPRQRDATFIDGLWRVLQHPQTLENLALVGKSYGDGAIKVEPRALERLRLPPEALAQAGLASVRGVRQLRLMETEAGYDVRTTQDNN